MTLDQLVDVIESDVGDSYEQCICLMLGCITLVEKFLPKIGFEALELARKYWMEKSINSSQLEEARVRCWQYLDKRNASTNTQEKEYCALRSVICVLYVEQPSDDIGELIEFFLEMISSVEGNINSIERIVKEQLPQ